MKKPINIALAIFLAVVAFLLWEFKPLPPAEFSPQGALPTNLPPFFASSFLPKVAKVAHASTMTILPNGKLMAAWYAGEREGAKDVAIFTSVLEKSGWSTPQKLITRELVAGSVLAQVRKIGNPVLFTANGKVWLWFVSVGIGGWAASQINVMQSEDGQKWSPPRRLVTSPFFNISTLVRTRPVYLANNEMALPISHESFMKFSEFLRLDENGKILMKTRLPNPATLQPAIEIANAKTAHAFLRDYDEKAAFYRVRHAITSDGGTTWQALAPTDIPNVNNSIATAKLPSGAWLLVGNDLKFRTSLNAWISKDFGKTWQLVRNLEKGDGEYSYPFLLVDAHGRIHLSYTWRRETIRYMVFSQAWLMAGDSKQ